MTVQPPIIATIWWVLFWAVVGLGVGSFLNVVIHRLPRNRSLRDPLWSACPYCGHRIRFRDNLPILSFLLLRGRCRDCGQPIGTRYVVIEASMAVITLLLLDAFFVGQVRDGLLSSVFGLTDELSQDWPVFLAHLVLFACLLSMSVIDMEHYWVDIRFTNLATIVGLICHTLWTPRHSVELIGRASGWHRPSTMTAAVSIAALLGLVVVWFFRARQRDSEEEFGLDPVPDGDSAPVLVSEGSNPADQHAADTGVLKSKVDPGPAPISPSVLAERNPPPNGRGLEMERARCARPSRLLVFVFVAVLLGMLVTTTAAELTSGGGPFSIRAAIPLILFFVLIVREGSIVRTSDEQIVEAIHQERHGARRMALMELAVLAPSVLAAMGMYLAMRTSDSFATGVDETLHWRVQVSGLSMWQGWMPLYGFATAVSGYFIAGAVGWAVRIVFTLLFGKEAFGAGDIHLMAAAGCVAGWPAVVIGFFLTCGLAMFGWLLTLPFKRSRAMPLGPWLSLSFLVVVVFHRPMMQFPTVQQVIAAWRFLTTENSQDGFFGGES